MNQQLKLQWEEEFEKADVQSVRRMLAQEPGLVNVRVRQSNQEAPRWGPLFVASVKLNSLDKVKALIEAGANINNSELGTHWPSTDYEINRYFVERGIDVNQPSFLGFHALGVTEPDSFLLMMKNGLDPNFTWDYIGQTMLHMQALHDADKELACAYILAQAGADVNAQARTGYGERTRHPLRSRDPASLRRPIRQQAASAAFARPWGGRLAQNSQSNRRTEATRGVDGGSYVIPLAHDRVQTSPV